MKLLNKQVVVVTGGAGLIGQEFIREIIKHNGVAVIADIDSDLGESTKIELSRVLNTEDIDFVQIDISSKQSVINSIEHLNDKYGKIDALINNAYPRNKNYGRHFFDVEYDDFSQNLSLHLGGYFLTSQQYAKYFKKQGCGNIINISSIYGVISPKFEIYKNTLMTTPVEYVAIKSALISLTKYMAKYFKGMNIRVNSISPGGILDNQNEMFVNKYNDYCLNKGMLNIEDLSGTIVFLLSDMSKYINGQNIIVDDGFTL
jgi:NAD(P)-dependent dehydrogenase (short-subunit alcohol dehydrogenase family)